MKYFILIIALFCTTAVFSQDFTTAISNAKTSYAAGKLEDAHFALMQAMQEIDIVIGKQVLAKLPSKMDTFSVNTQDDNVLSNVGFMGSTIHRSWGTENQVDLSIIGNSPIISTLNTFLNAPLFGGMSNNGNNKVIKVHGYKGQLTKDEGSTTGQSDYTVQIPMGSSLVTFTAKNSTETQVMAWINTVPLPDIVKLLQ